MTEEKKTLNKPIRLIPPTSDPSTALVPTAVEVSSTIELPEVLSVPQESFVECCIVIRAQLDKLENAIFQNCLAIADLITGAKVKYDLERSKEAVGGRSSDLTSESFVKAAALQLDRSPAFVQRFLTISKLDTETRALVVGCAWRYLDNQTVLLALARESEPEKRVAAITALQSGDRSGFNAALRKSGKPASSSDPSSEQGQMVVASEAKCPLKQLQNRGFISEEAAALIAFQRGRDPASLDRITKHAALFLDIIVGARWKSSKQTQAAVSDTYVIDLMTGYLKPPTKEAKKVLAGMLGKVSSTPQDETHLTETFAALVDAYER